MLGLVLVVNLFYRLNLRKARVRINLREENEKMSELEVGLSEEGKETKLAMRTAEASQGRAHTLVNEKEKTRKNP